MIELIKKTLFTTIGVASLTKDKVEEIAKDFVEQGKMTEQEGRKLVDEIMTKSKESQEEFTRKVEEIVEGYVAKLNLAKASELEELRAKVRSIKEKIETSEQDQ